MDRERFNTLLQDPTKVSNTDIKALNEYRKKYPYFQGLYVIVAKALKERSHPKTDTFIKKAAIYSVDRSYLKTIIEGDFAFKEKEDIIPTPVEKVPNQKQDSSPKPEKQTPQQEVKPESTVQPETKEEPKHKPQETNSKSKATNPKQEVAQKPKEEKVEVKKVEVEKPEPLKPAITSSKKVKTKEPAKAQAKEQEDHSFDELRATKLRIEALLRGELPENEQEEAPESQKEEKKQEQEKSQVPPKKTVKDHQVELIEKFINTDPTMDLKRKIGAEEDTPLEDLSMKQLKKAEELYTETMAQLLVNQKKYKRAIQIYEKLRLKFPKKSTYFARQIEKIKSEYNV